MKKLHFNNKRAIFKAFLTFLAFVILAIVFISDRSIASLLIASLIVIFGLKASQYVYKLVGSRPPSDLSRFATPDLDNLKPIPGSGIIELTSDELIKEFEFDKLKQKEGELKIWGDWKTNTLNKPKTILSIDFNKESKMLSFYFSNGQLQIFNPSQIHIAKNNYLKVQNADKILWKWDELSTLIYFKDGNNIKKKSNVTMQFDEFDTDSSQPALIFRTSLQ